MKPSQRSKPTAKQTSGSRLNRTGGGKKASAARVRNSERPRVSGGAENAGRGGATDQPRNSQRSRDSQRPRPSERARDAQKPFAAERNNSFARREHTEQRNLPEKSAQVSSLTTPQRQFYFWGRRPIENYLTRFQEQESINQKTHGLFVIVDKSGRVPAQLKTIVEPCKALGIKITLCKSQDDEQWPLASDEPLNHQRVCLRVPNIPTVSIHDIAQTLPDMMSETPHGCLGLILDQIQDPRNFGAILRTAAFFGAKFVIFGEDRQAEITPLVVKTSSGGAFSLQLVPTVNINRALEILKKSGVWVVGSSLQASARHDELPLDRHYVLVVGNESKGMRQEVSRHCDYLVKIPGGVSAVDSLNVGVATGVLLSTLQNEICRSSANLSHAMESDNE